MIKINFSTPLKRSQRNAFIHCMRDLGFVYDRINQSGEYALLRFYGELPDIKLDNFEFVIVADGQKKTDLLKFFLKSARVEITIPFEREEKEHEITDESGS